MLPGNEKKQVKKPSHARRGFSMVELAVVLGIVSMVLGAIWVYAGQASQTADRQKLTQQLVTVVNGMRSLYLGQANVCGTFDQLTARLSTQNAISPAMVRTAGCTNVGSPPAAPAGICVDTPWGPAGNLTTGSFAVGAGPYLVASVSGSTLASPCLAGNNPQQQFTVELRGISFANCVNIVPQNSGANGPPGLRDVIINTNDIMTNVAATHVLPVLVKDAQQFCNAASTIDFVYRLQASAY